ncbi:GroES-like protein [Calocera viscosa TUFC12733]|uniref:GroES-like protein n=1 Tax=Calocera viscosa (strain TUFC12733) TaxID=1330018 RepID=A0A167MT98_CALVF|nr:GroES-like protein [Calocera viscosa TUFC12733]
MAQNLGILINEPFQKKLAPAQPVELWEPGPGALRILIKTAAQNPADWKMIDYNFGLASFPYIIGFDAAGIVDKVGEGVSKFKVGDRVAGMSPLGGGPGYGTYQKYCLIKADAALLIPASYSFDQAATMPGAFWTVALGLFACSGLQIPLPLDGEKVTPKVQGETLLVWGGSSGVGALAVQIGVISGFKVIATASPKNFEYVKSLGAETVLDYHDADIADQIKGLAPNLRYAFDAIGEKESTSGVLSSLNHIGSEVATVLPSHGEATSGTNPVTHHIFAGSMYFPEQDTLRLGLAAFWQILVNEGKIIPHPTKLMPNGLNSIDEGFDFMRQGKVSGVKLVYHPEETRI